MAIVVYAAIAIILYETVIKKLQLLGVEAKTKAYEKKLPVYLDYFFLRYSCTASAATTSSLKM